MVKRINENSGSWPSGLIVKVILSGVEILKLKDSPVSEFSNKKQSPAFPFVILELSECLTCSEKVNVILLIVPTFCAFIVGFEKLIIGGCASVKAIVMPSMSSNGTPTLLKIEDTDAGPIVTISDPLGVSG